MRGLIAQYFNVDKEFTLIILRSPFGIGFVKIEDFIELFGPALQTALDKGTNPIDEIKRSDPENQKGFNDIL